METSTISPSQDEYHFPDINLSQLKLLYCGREKCTPKSYDGPSMRNHYVFHLVLSGSGRLTVGQQAYNICGNTGFLIYPDVVTHYAPDRDDPWEYVWVGIAGDAMEKLLTYTCLSAGMPVFTPPDFRLLSGTVEKLIETIRTGGTANMIRCYCLMLEFLSRLIDQTSVFDDRNIAPDIETIPEHYMREAIRYIKSNLQNNFSVSDIARHLGLNRSYFSKVFRERCGKTPIAFILSNRLNNAWHLLQYTDQSTAQIAQNVGFVDPSYFTRQFTSRYGYPPRALRKIAKQNNL